MNLHTGVGVFLKYRFVFVSTPFAGRLSVLVFVSEVMEFPFSWDRKSSGASKHAKKLAKVASQLSSTYLQSTNTLGRLQAGCNPTYVSSSRMGFIQLTRSFHLSCIEQRTMGIQTPLVPAARPSQDWGTFS